METAVKVWTDEDLMALPKDGFKRELLNGKITVSPTGSEHGRISFSRYALDSPYAATQRGAVWLTILGR